MKNSYKVGIAAVALLVGVTVFPLLGLLKSNKNTVTISQDNLLILRGEINGASAAELMEQAKSKSSSSKPLYLFVNTPGGEIQTGLELMEALNGLNRPINTVTLFAASMGFQVVQGLGERLILRNGVLMSHRARGSFEGFFGGKKGSQLENRVNFWMHRMEELDQQTVNRSNGKQTLESYQKAYADELWITGQQAVDGGYADKIVTVRCDSSLSGVTTSSVDFLGAKILFDLSNCPINTNPLNIRVQMPENKVSVNGLNVLEIKAKFLEQYLLKQHSVIPMTW